jgi:hypothetical protein
MGDETTACSLNDKGGKGYFPFPPPNSRNSLISYYTNLKKSF